MGKKLKISFDTELIEMISADFDLRTPNKKALRELIYTLDGDYNPDVMQVLNLATGVGKTYLASCLANEMLKKEYSVCFVSAFALNESLQKYHTTFDGSKSLWLDPFIDADILIIDDLGTEPMIKNVTENYLYLILSERERFSRPVIITTNLKPADINSRYDERIYSRLCNKKNAQLFRIEGDDLRIK